MELKARGRVGGVVTGIRRRQWPRLGPGSGEVTGSGSPDRQDIRVKKVQIIAKYLRSGLWY